MSSNKTFKFPDGFLWGSATSSHQVEGGNLNDWTEWEKSDKRREDLEKSGKLKQHSLENYISGRACDHYNRFREDFDITKSLNHNVHRFSIEWSRVEPEEGRFDEKEIEHYREVIRALRERGIKPFVTLWHWTNPVWFSKKGGWLNKQAPKYFEKYVSKIAESLGDEIKFWITINEPIIYTSHSYLRGIWPPQQKSLLKALRVIGNLAKAHNLAYSCLHSINPDFQTGIAKNNIYFKNNPIADYFWDSYFFNKIKNAQDFIGLNYYFHHRLFKKRNLPISDLDWQIYPRGIYYILKGLKKHNKQIYITENGLADAKDEKREKFIKEHLQWVQRAIEEGVDVRGYLYWSLLDNFEWNRGFWPRFGLVEMDYKTMERKIRPSALEYAKICKTNELETL